jgi:hypothetical protein
MSIIRRVGIISVVLLSLVGAVVTGSSAAPTAGIGGLAVKISAAQTIDRFVGTAVARSPVGSMASSYARLAAAASSFVGKLHEIHAQADAACARSTSPTVSDQLWNAVLSNLNIFSHTGDSTWDAAIAFVTPKVVAFRATVTPDVCTDNNLQQILDAGKQYFAPYMVVALLPLVEPNQVNLAWALLNRIEIAINSIS